MILKFATVGSNFIVDNFNLAVKASGVAEIRAVFSRNIDRAKECVEKWNVNATAFDDFDYMLEFGDIDCVYVATPNSLHFHQGMKVLMAKKHLLLEKPATLTLDEFLILEKTARENGVVFLEAMRVFHSASFDLVEENIARVGKIRAVDFSFSKVSSRYENFKNGIVENAFVPSFGNGTLVDLGVYPLSAMIRLFGKPNSVVAVGDFLDGSIDCSGNITAKYDDFFVNIGYSKVSTNYRQNEISGEDGSLLFYPCSLPQTISFASGEEFSNVDFEFCKTDMQFEICDFAKCIEDPSLCEKYNSMTRIVIELCETVAKQVGIDYFKK